MHRQTLIALSALIFGTGCADLGPTGHDPEDFVLPPGAPAPVVLDSASYTLTPHGRGYQVQARARFTNPYEHPVYLGICMPGDRLPKYHVRRSGADSTHESALPLAWACVGTTSMPVLWPGRSITLDIHLGGSWSPAYTLAEWTGTYRIELALCTGPGSNDSCEPLPAASRSSATFTVLPPP